MVPPTFQDVSLCGRDDQADGAYLWAVLFCTCAATWLLVAVLIYEAFAP